MPEPLLGGTWALATYLSFPLILLFLTRQRQIVGLRSFLHIFNMNALRFVKRHPLLVFPIFSREPLLGGSRVPGIILSTPFPCPICVIFLFSVSLLHYESMLGGTQTQFLLFCVALILYLCMILECRDNSPVYLNQLDIFCKLRTSAPTDNLKVVCKYALFYLPTVPHPIMYCKLFPCFFL